jgi:hypothetical protein
MTEDTTHPLRIEKTDGETVVLVTNYKSVIGFQMFSSL